MNNNLMNAYKGLGFMLDTNIFNDVLDGTISISILKELGGELFTTHIQLYELTATTDPQRRKELLELFHKVVPKELPTESSVWTITRPGNAKWTTSDSLYAPIVRLLAVGQKRWNARKHESNMRDALIAETAIRNNLVLLTNDAKLLRAVEELGGHSSKLAI